MYKIVYTRENIRSTSEGTGFPPVQLENSAVERQWVHVSGLSDYKENLWKIRNTCDVTEKCHRPIL